MITWRSRSSPPTCVPASARVTAPPRGCAERDTGSRGNLDWVRRLYLRLYFAFLGVLVAVVTVTAGLNYFVGRPLFGLLHAGPRMANHLARMLPPLERRDALERIVGE